jgi:hypothetical protein
LLESHEAFIRFSILNMNIKIRSKAARFFRAVLSLINTYIRSSFLLLITAYLVAVWGAYINNDLIMKGLSIGILLTIIYERLYSDSAIDLEKREIEYLEVVDKQTDLLDELAYKEIQYNTLFSKYTYLKNKLKMFLTEDMYKEFNKYNPKNH